MKKNVLCLVFSIYLLAHAACCYSQQWKQQVGFTIDVTLNDQEHTLDGFEKITYINNSPDTLQFIWFHVWANAFKNDRTAYSEYLLNNDRTDFYFSNKDQKGYINRLDFKVNGVTARTEDHPNYIDIIKLVLPHPLVPGAKATIGTPFHVQLPYNFSGNGHIKHQYEIAQWLATPALYDASGWHTLPYTNQQEGANQAGNYEVSIHVPENYTVKTNNGELPQITDTGGYHYISKNSEGFRWSAGKPETPGITKGKPVRKQQIQLSNPFENEVNKLFDVNKIKPFSVLPAVGYNLYDGLMIGAIFHNYLSAQKPFRFVAVPLYATRAKTLNGIARASYTWNTTGAFKNIEAGTSIAKFSISKTPDEVQPAQYSGFFKLAPFIRLTLKDEEHTGKLNRYIQLKHYYIREESFQYKEVITGTDTSLGASIAHDATNITQLKLVVQNTRKLYPYSGELNIEHHKNFIRAAFTGNYYFNYANNNNGLNVRFFAGKLFYSGKSEIKSFNSLRYHLNLSGANGEEDYTYSNYFIGRNEFEGFQSQQIMIRDGGFKVRTDLLSDKVGKTDNWLAAANFTTGIPDNINPLSIFPIKIPLRIFADIGTNAAGWQNNSEEDRFLFDAGLQLSLFNETVNIYAPIFCSKVFRDYNKSYLGEKRFLKTISFSINIQNLLPGRIFPDIKRW